MEPNENNPKTVLSVRLWPSAKQKLANEAERLGTTLSEHAERILLNADHIKIDDSSEQLKQENTLLVQQIEALKAASPVFKYPEVLLNLFEEVKGMTDEVLASDGKMYTITYNSPADLLWTMIHSFKLKQ